MTSQGDLQTVIGQPSASRRLSKLKRLLASLQQDGPDGDQVQRLVGDLVNNGISAEEFVARLKSLRQVGEDVQALIPVVKDGLPLLQKELNQAVVSLQHRYPSSQSSAHFRPPSPGSDSRAIIDLDRRGAISPRHSGLREVEHIKPHHMEPVPKRARIETDRSRSPRPGHEYDIRGPDSRHVSQQPRSYGSQSQGTYSVMNGVGSRSSAVDQPVIDTEPPPSHMNDWDTLMAMMNIIHTMVEKLFQALGMLREIQVHDRQQWMAYLQRQRDELAYVQRQRDDLEQDIPPRPRRVYGSTVADPEPMGRRVDTFVDVRKPSVAVGSGHGEPESLSRGGGGGVWAGQVSMQTRGERRGEEVRYQPATSTRHDDTSLEEGCWSCGREASETCSRCKKARYCGVECQRKDWRQNHHKQCRPPTPDESSEAAPAIIVNGGEHGVAVMTNHGVVRAVDEDHSDGHHPLPPSDGGHS